ncbi:MAG: hypothetical protein WBF90_16785 [Rivularia sp. (in: cyanobacteria)]
MREDLNGIKSLNVSKNSILKQAQLKTDIKNEEVEEVTEDKIKEEEE